MSYFPALRKDEGEVNILLISTIVFGIIALGFSITSVLAITDAQHSRSTLDSQKKTAYSSGQNDQKAQDAKDQLAANESPFRSYVASELFGNFEIKFPKNWNAYVVEDLSSTTQVNLTLQPDLVRLNGGQGKANNYAFRALLIKTDSTTLNKTFADRIKNKKLTTKNVTVSGITATQYIGALDDTHNGIMTVVPVRDKSLELITDSTTDYLGEYNQILSQAVIVK
jgi:hypothetical protein